jgi:hypothetical protein
MSAPLTIEKMVEDAIAQKVEDIKFTKEWNQKRPFRDAQYNLFCDTLKMKAKEIGYDVRFSSYDRGGYDKNSVMTKPPEYDFELPPGISLLQ